MNRLAFFESLDSMVSRGPDSSGWKLFNCSGHSSWKARQYEDRFTCLQDNLTTPTIMIGHRRLSVIDLSEAGHQPMSDPNGRIWITYNGEVYNYLELRKELEQLGHKFSTESDTEVVLRSYQAWGKGCFNRFNGMWGMAIIDLEKGKVLLSRDRFGIKPLYYRKTKNSFFFGSTIQSVLTMGNADRRSRHDVVRDFLLYGLQPSGEDTFFQGVQQVANGSLIEIDVTPRHNISLSKERWWTIHPRDIPDSEAIQQWGETFEDAVRIRMRSDVPLGSCLSGGIDSSAIVAFMNKLDPTQNIHTVTSCYEDKKWDERRYVELMLGRIKAKPTWVYPEMSSLANDLNLLHLTQEEPIPTISIYNQFCVMRDAKKSGVTVLLDGQGADELFLGYDSCQTIHMLNLLRRGKLLGFGKKLAGLSANRSSMGILNAFTMLIYFGLPAIRESRNKLRMRSVLKRESLDAPGEGTFKTTVESTFDLQHARIGWVERNPLPSLLHYEDRNSMAFSVETRLPFLDYRMVNLAFSLSHAMLEKNGWPKFVCRKAIESLVPKEIVWRKDKMGFPGPTVFFMQKNRDVFLDMFKGEYKSSSVINGKVVHAMLSSGQPPEWLWRVLSVEVWLRVMNVEI